MNDHVQIEGLKVFGYHGVNRDEREHGQEFIVDIDAEVDLKDAGRSDLLGQTLDYSSVIKEVNRIVSVERFTLIEALAHRIAESVLEHDLVKAVTVKVTKPSPPIDEELDGVSVKIRRRA